MVVHNVVRSSAMMVRQDAAAGAVALDDVVAIAQCQLLRLVARQFDRLTHLRGYDPLIATLVQQGVDRLDTIPP